MHSFPYYNNKQLVFLISSLVGSGQFRMFQSECSSWYCLIINVQPRDADEM